MCTPKIKRGSPFLTAVLFVALHTSAHAQTTIAWKLNEGDRFFVEKTENVRQSLTLLAEVTKQSILIKRVARYDVLGKDKDGAYTINKTIASVDVKYEGGAEHGDQRIVKSLEGMRFQFKLTPTGIVSEYSGWDEYLKRLKDTGRTRLAALVEATFSQRVLQAADAVLFDVTPDKAVSPGDRWAKTFIEPLGPLGSMKLHTFYTLDGKPGSDGTVKIVKTSTISYRPPAKVDPKILALERGRLSSAHKKGTLSFDVGRGRLHKSEWQRRFKGEFTTIMDRKKVNWTLEHQQDVKVRVMEKSPIEK